MTERTLSSRSLSLGMDVDEAGQEKSFMETEANNASQETELDRTIVEVNEEVNNVTDRQVKGHSVSGTSVAMSVSQFHEFMSTAMKEFMSTVMKEFMSIVMKAFMSTVMKEFMSTLKKEFDDLKARIRSENT